MFTCVPRLIYSVHLRKISATLILALSIIAECAFAPAAHAATDYRLAPGDRIAITVFGNTELSGEFSIDASGQILYPLVGALQVGGLTLPDTEQRLATSLSDGILIKPIVFVRIAELRPIQVIGDVRNSGSFPFRAGTIVKSAIGLAGGYGMSLLSPGTTAAEFLAAEERLKVLQSNEWRLRVRYARLTAQASGKSRFDPPNAGGVSDADFSKAIEEETKYLSEQIDARDRKLALLRSQSEPMAAENDAIDAQIVSERKQLEIINKQIASYEKLQQSGLARFDAMIQLQLNASTKQGMIGRLQSEKSRLRSTIGELQLRLQDVETEYVKQASGEILEISQKLGEIDASIPLARQVRIARLREVSGSTTIGLKRQFFISRLTNGETQTLEATENDLIEPGDTIEVRTEVSELKTATGASLEQVKASQ